jgi:fructokinase
MIMPQTLLFGGGIINQRQLSPKIRAEVHHLLAGYVQHPSVLYHLDDYIVPPGLGKRAGIMGALALAMAL